MKKIIYCFILYFILSATLIQHYAYPAETNEKISLDRTPLYVMFVMDSSGTMKNTDPEDIRKLASQAIISLLSSEDKVAIVEFAQQAKILSDWKSANERDTIFNYINQIGNSGSFTDFRAGLETAKKLFENVPTGSDKVILLLSDGDFDPNPYSDTYAPYNIQYRLAIRGKNKSEVIKIDETFKNKLIPVAKRMIDADILPALRKEGIEIYTVGFSSGADRNFLNYLADETSKVKVEAHYFYANKAIDLMDAFVGLLHFWKNKITLKSEQGDISIGNRKNIPVDTFLTDVSFIALTDSEADFTVRADGSKKDEAILQGTHPNLKVATLADKLPPGVWSYGFNSGGGRYRLLVAGKSTLDMLISGIKEKYVYGEPVKANALIKINNQDARLYLAQGARVVAEITTATAKDGPVPLQEKKEGFSLEHVIQTPGKARIKFTLLAKDKQNNDLLPRPSKEFIAEILPRFYVEPGFIAFGDLHRGMQKEQTVKIHSGLTGAIKIEVKSSISRASRCQDMIGNLPSVEGDAFEIQPGQSLDKKLRLIVPAEGCWGDFEGKILFSSESGLSDKVGFRVHVPSLWERFTWFAIAAILIAVLALSLLTYLWGYLKSPVGVLRPVNYQPGMPLGNDIKLSGVKRGSWNRYFHWKKNIITIGSGHTDMRLPGLPKNMEAELIFHRFGGDYIKNVSPQLAGHILIVRNPDVGIDIDRGPGSSYQLSHGLYIKIQDYEFVYEHIK